MSILLTAGVDPEKFRTLYGSRVLSPDDVVARAKLKLDSASARIVQDAIAIAQEGNGGFAVVPFLVPENTTLLRAGVLCRYRCSG